MNKIVAEDIERILSAPLPWDDFSGTSILVSGAAGFLPAYMVETLLTLNTRLSKPCKVIGLVRNMGRAAQRFVNYADDSNLSLRIHDIRNPLHPSPAVDFIIHAASQSSPLFYRSDPIGTLAANTQGTFNLLNMDVITRAECRGFLYFSSGEVYGHVSQPSVPITETHFGYLDPLDPRSCYAESKRMGETLCAAFTSQHGLLTKIVRPFHTYGPGMRLDDGRVFADFTRDILGGGPITLNSDGRARRSFCYLADATIGFFTALLKGQCGEAYNVSNPAMETSIADLAKRLGTEFNLPVTHATSSVGSHQTLYLPSTILSTFPSVAKLNGLGWMPTTSIETGFRRTVESYRC